MEEKPILVLGDTCKDVFVYCSCERLCPEAPVPVLDIIEKIENKGMAGNVANNILSLKYPCELITNENWESVTKTRYVEKRKNHMFIRIDSPTKICPLNDIASIDLSKYAAVICADYHKGFLTEADMYAVSKRHPLTFLDTKRPLGAWANNFTFIKINRNEYRLSEQLIKIHGLEDKIIQTLGSDGCKYQGKIYPVKEVEVKDLSGAGDSFLAALAYYYICNKDIHSAIVFANECASIVVQKMGVSVINE